MKPVSQIDREALTRVRPHKHLKNRREVVEAFETLGSIADCDLTSAECIELASSLLLLATFAESKGYAIAHRLTGAITTAKLSEARAELAFDALPSFLKW